MAALTEAGLAKFMAAGEAASISRCLAAMQVGVAMLSVGMSRTKATEPVRRRAAARAVRRRTQRGLRRDRRDRGRAWRRARSRAVVSMGVASSWRRRAEMGASKGVGLGVVMGHLARGNNVSS